MAATAIRDFYMPLRPGREPHHYVTAGRFAMAAWGVVLAAFACVCVRWQGTSGGNLIDFALGVMTFAYAGLLAVFVAAIFTGRGNSASAIAAMMTGFVAVGAFQPWAWQRWASHVPLAGLSGGSIRTLADVKIEYPWHLVFSSVVALGVCVAGRRRPGRG
jgi:Na+/proline symporter